MAIAHELECIGYILFRKEEPQRAVSLISAAQTIRKVINMPRTTLEDSEYEKELNTLHKVLGEERFQAHWNTGAELSMEAAILMAMKE